MENENAPSQNPAPVSAPSGEAPESDVPAGFWLRGGAYMIDGIIVVVASAVPALLLPEGLRALTQLAIAGSYFTFLPVAYGGQTLGKMAAGVKIVRNDGSALTHGRACARWASYLLSNLTLCLGFLCAAFTPHKRALHDYVAGTRVVRVQELGFGRKLAVILVGLLFPLIVLLGIAAATALPEFDKMKNQAGETDVRSRLALLRTAAASYSSANGGANPADLNALVPKYVAAIPAGPADPPVAGVETYGPEVCSGSTEPGRELIGANLRGTGKWGYVAAPKAPCDGRIFIDSPGADSKGAEWTSY